MWLLNRVIFWYIILGLLGHDVILITYVSTSTFSVVEFRNLSVTLIVGSFILNGFVLVKFAYNFSQLDRRQLFLRNLVLFPVNLIGANLLLLLNPVLLRRLLQCVGITDIRYVLYAAVWIFYCKMLTIGIFDIFCQCLIIWHNIEVTHQSNLISILFLFSSALASISIFSFIMCCGLGIIVEYLEQYRDLTPLRERLIALKVSPYQRSKDDGEMCCICLEEFEEGEKIERVVSCNHFFHEKCLNQWLECKEICPLCRSK